MYIRNIMLLLAKYNIHLIYTHIKGVNNDIADVLSRVRHDSRYDWVKTGVCISTTKLKMLIFLICIFLT